MRRTIFASVCVLPVILALLGAHAKADGIDLLLRCDGTVTHTAADTNYADASNSSGDTASANVTTYRKERFSERLLLDLKADGTRIRLPRSMVPPLNSGGQDGWWPLSDIVVSEGSITARFRLNPINKPAIRIDRSTGDIDMSGFGIAFRGSCEPQSRSERKF